MNSEMPILSGHSGNRAFEIYEPVQGEHSQLCRLVIRENQVVIWDNSVFGEDRNNAIHCAIIALGGFFDDLRLPPKQVARAMDASAAGGTPSGGS